MSNPHAKDELDPEQELLKLIDKLCRMRERWDHQRGQLHDLVNSLRHPVQGAKFHGKLKQLNRCIADLDFVIARNRRNVCAWHRGQTRITKAPGEDVLEPACQNCGRMLAVDVCTGCKEMFFDWDYFRRGTSDDVVAAPGVTSSGDLYCRDCARRHDAEAERVDEEPWEFQGP